MAKEKKEEEPPGLIQQFSNWRNERKQQKQDEQAQKKQHRIEAQEGIIQTLEDECARHEARLATLKKRYARGEGKSAELAAEINNVRGEINLTRGSLIFQMKFLLEIRQSDDGIPRR